MEGLEAKEWTGCYREKRWYKRLFHPETNRHPAKMAWGLLERIFKELEKMGLLREGDIVLDFMSGSGRTNIWAGLKGYRSISVELEPHFIEMQRLNKETVERYYGREWPWEIIQGDARELSKLLEEKGLVGVTSPPYSDSQTHPSIGSVNKDRWGEENIDIVLRRGLKEQTRYSPNPDNIGNLPDKGSLVGITSPPYANRMDGGCTKEGYSHIFPYDDNETKPDDYRRRWPTDRDSKNIGNLMDGVNHKDGRETYLSAMQKVYCEAAKVCKILVTVTKNPTRDGKLRRLDLDTIQLCRNAGFEPVAWFRARLFKKCGQRTLDNGTLTEYKGRISFFKRLLLEKGNVAAEWEDVIFFVNRGYGDFH